MDRPQTFSDVVTMFERMSNLFYESLNLTREEQLLAMQGAMDRIKEVAVKEDEKIGGFLRSVEAITKVMQK